MRDDPSHTPGPTAAFKDGDVHRGASPLSARPVDIAFIAVFVVFLLTSVIFDRTAAFVPDLRGAESGIPAALRAYGEALDPLVLDNPLWLRWMSGISGLVFGAFYVYAAWAFAVGHDSVRRVGLLYCGAMGYSMVVHLGMEFSGDLPPPSPWLAVAVYAPYTALPIALAARLWREHPFVEVPAPVRPDAAPRAKSVA